jgi:hypothetical protein
MFAQKRHPKPVIELIKPQMDDVDISPPPENSDASKETSKEKE